LSGGQVGSQEGRGLEMAGLFVHSKVSAKSRKNATLRFMTGEREA
jgi:hypothetical protein